MLYKFLVSLLIYSLLSLNFNVLAVTISNQNKILAHSVSIYNSFAVDKNHIFPKVVSKKNQAILDEYLKRSGKELPKARLNDNNQIELLLGSNKVIIEVMNQQNEIIKINDTKINLSNYHTFKEKIHAIEALFTNENSTFVENVVNFLFTPAIADCLSKYEDKIKELNPNDLMPERKGIYKLPYPAMWATAIGMLVLLILPSTWPIAVYKVGAYSVFGSSYLVNEKQRELKQEEKDLEEIYQETAFNEVNMRDAIVTAKKGSFSEDASTLDEETDYKEINFHKLHLFVNSYFKRKGVKQLSTKEFAQSIIEGDKSELFCHDGLMSLKEVSDSLINQKQLDPNKILSEIPTQKSNNEIEINSTTLSLKPLQDTPAGDTTTSTAVEK